MRRVDLSGLNDRQRAFVYAYVVHKNATRAAEAAGYSKSTAASQGSRLLKNCKIRRAIDVLLDRAAERAELTLADIVLELRRILVADPVEVLHDDGTVLPLSEWPEDLRRALSSFELVEAPDGTKVRKFRLWSKTEAARDLMRHLGGFRDTVELQVKLADLLAAAGENLGES